MLRQFLVSALAGFVVAALIYFVGTQSTGAAIIGGGVATLAALVFLGWRDRRRQRPKPGASAKTDPRTLRPPTHEELLAHAEKIRWGDDRYRGEAEWNDSERRAFLRLFLRDPAGSVGYRVGVLDPSDFESEWGCSQAVSHGQVTNLYRDEAS